MLQLVFFFIGWPMIFGKGAAMEREVAAIVAFSLNYAAYFAEIFRGGIQSIPRGQYEAAQVLGLSHRQCFFKIIVPQVVKRVIPPMGNEFVTLVKDTALGIRRGHQRYYPYRQDDYDESERHACLCRRRRLLPDSHFSRHVPV